MMPATARQKARKNSSALSGAGANSDVDKKCLVDFEGFASPMMVGGNRNNDGGSIGTRSPSPSDISGSTQSGGSKRSRTGDDDDDDDDQNMSPKKRAAAPTSMNFIRSEMAQAQRSESPALMVRMDREREGRCPDCGLETHETVRRKDGSFEKQPLNIDGEVLNGKCLFCNPPDDYSGSDTSSQQFIHDVQHNGLSPITSSAHWPKGRITPTSKRTPVSRKQSPRDNSKRLPRRNTYQKDKTISPLNNMWQHNRNEGDMSVSSVPYGDGLDTVDSNLTDDSYDERSHRSGASQKSGGVEKLGKAIESGMAMSSNPRMHQQQRTRAPDPPTLKSIPSKSPKPQTPNQMNSRAIVRKHSSEEEVQNAVAMAHSKLASSIYHHHMYPLENRAEQAFIEKTRTYLESGSGDICDVVVAMRRFPFSISIQSVACEKLFVHCFEHDHANAIGLCGGIRTVIDAMEHHPNDVALQHTCVRMLKHLACAGPYNLNMLDRMGAVAIIMATMERHSQNAMLLEACCWTIEGMARAHSPDFKMRVARGGGIHAAMKVVETFPDNDALLRAAFHCLRQLGYNPSSFGNHQPQQNNMGGIS